VRSAASAAKDMDGALDAAANDAVEQRIGDGDEVGAHEEEDMVMVIPMEIPMVIPMEILQMVMEIPMAMEIPMVMEIPMEIPMEILIMVMLIRHLQVLRCTAQLRDVVRSHLEADPVAELGHQLKGIGSPREIGQLEPHERNRNLAGIVANVVGSVEEYSPAAEIPPSFFFLFRFLFRFLFGILFGISAAPNLGPGGIFPRRIDAASVAPPGRGIFPPPELIDLPSDPLTPCDQWELTNAIIIIIINIIISISIIIISISIIFIIFITSIIIIRFTRIHPTLTTRIHQDHHHHQHNIIIVRFSRIL
jgi:hypothetical protein